MDTHHKIRHARLRRQTTKIRLGMLVLGCSLALYSFVELLALNSPSGFFSNAVIGIMLAVFSLLADD